MATDSLRRIRAHEVDRLAGKLGSRQRSVLLAMCEHGGWPGQWRYGTDHETKRILDSLVRRGDVVVTQVPYRDWLGRPLPEWHPYYGKTQDSYRLAEKWRDVMSGKTSTHHDGDR